MKYFCSCFICGSSDDDCGHREAPLIVWWRAMQGWKLMERGRPLLEPDWWSRQKQLVAAPETPLPAIAAPSEVVPVRKPSSGAHSGHDCAKLEKGRMPWPKNQVTRDIALGQKR